MLKDDIHALKDKQNDSGDRPEAGAHETTYHDSTRSHCAYQYHPTEWDAHRFNPKTRGYESHGQASGCKPLPHA